MCNVYAYAVMAVMSAAGANEQAQAKGDELDAGAYSYEDQAEIYDEKAIVAQKESSLSEAQAMDSLVRGKTVEKKFRTQGKMLVGSQRASIGASGVRVDTGVSTDVVVDTERVIEGDAMTLRSNAERESYGFKLNAWRQRGEARTYLKSAENARKAAEDAREAADKARSGGIMGAFTSLGNSASNYKGK